MFRSSKPTLTCLVLTNCRSCYDICFLRCLHYWLLKYQHQRSVAVQLKKYSILFLSMRCDEMLHVAVADIDTAYSQKIRRKSVRIAEIFAKNLRIFSRFSRFPRSNGAFWSVYSVISMGYFNLKNKLEPIWNNLT